MEIATGTATLLSVERKVRYGVQDLSCGGNELICRGGFFDLYPTSASGIECSGESCRGTITLTGHAAAALGSAGVTFHVCRNDQCGDASDSYNIYAGTGFQSSGVSFSGKLRGGAGYTMLAGGGFTYGVEIDVEQAQLRNGDHYTVEVAGIHGVIGSLATDAVYQESFPNGPECDAVACREFHFKGP